MSLEKNFEVFLNLINTNKFDECLSKLEKEKKIFPSPLYENLHGIILAKKNLVEDAKLQFLNTIKKYPDFPDAYYNLGTIFFNQENYLDAENLLKKSVELRDGYYEAIFNLGNLYRKTNRINQAIEAYHQCERIYEGDAELYNALGLCYQIKKNYRKAITSFNKGLSLKNDAYQIYNNLGLVYYDINNFEPALSLLKKSIEINPRFSDGYMNIGNTYREIQDYDNAMYYYEKSIELNKNSYQLFYNLARCKIELKSNYFSAIKDLHKAIFLKSNYPAAHALLAGIYLELFDHKKVFYHLKESIEKLNESYYIQYCSSLYIFNSNYLINFEKLKYFNCADYLSKSFIQTDFVFEKKNCSNTKKIKIGFFSGDFYRHAVAFQIIELISKLAANNEFEIYAYYNRGEEDALTNKFKKLFFKWNDVSKLPINEIIDLARTDKLDIAIDLSGHTKNNLLEVFFNRVANKQITWCGYLNSTGVKNMDYILGDKFVFSENDNSSFSEKILKMQHCWTNLTINNNVSVDLDLPCKKNHYITFGCFNNLRKINNELIYAWSKILLSVDNSKLYLKSKNFSNIEYCNFFYEKMNEFGIEKSRLIIEKDSNRNELLNNYNKIDIALDTFPYNGGTTTLEAYSMCVPVLTLVGQNFISRCGYSVNSNLGLNDWSCFTYDEYIEKGISFAKNVKLLEQVRKYLIENRKKTPVFNSELFTKDFTDTIKTVLN